MDNYFRPDFPGQTAQEHFEAWSLAQEAAQAVKAARIKLAKKVAIRAAVASGILATGFAVGYLWDSKRSRCLKTVGIDLK